ncbi:hypothetical protein [Xanthomonas arboricola]|uniref:hypothetical protein n=1 Tax=Xanthomonas arboricola TaxID=56448 RepID=UPI0011B0F19B|nr:hypothetical protein [Xanthomonas arboricola]
MNEKWTTHFDGEIEGRPVIIKTYSGGGYLVETTQAEDYEGKVFSDGSSTAIIPPSSRGARIDIDGETIDEVRDQLASENFSEEAIIDILKHFST